MTAIDRLRDVAARTAGLELLVPLVRARDDAHELSDWDLGYLADATLDVSGLLASIVETAGSDRVDLGSRSCRRAAPLSSRAHGRLVFEARPRLMETFCLEAADFWCDAEPILRRGYDGVLAALDREPVR